MTTNPHPKHRRASWILLMLEGIIAAADAEVRGGDPPAWRTAATRRPVSSSPARPRQRPAHQTVGAVARACPWCTPGVSFSTSPRPVARGAPPPEDPHALSTCSVSTTQRTQNPELHSASWKPAHLPPCLCLYPQHRASLSASQHQLLRIPSLTCPVAALPRPLLVRSDQDSASFTIPLAACFFRRWTSSTPLLQQLSDHRRSSPVVQHVQVTKPKIAAPKANHANVLVTASFSPDTSLNDIIHYSASRLREPNAIVIFKSLVVPQSPRPSHDRHGLYDAPKLAFLAHVTPAMAVEALLGTDPSSRALNPLTHDTARPHQGPAELAYLASLVSSHIQSAEMGNQSVNSMALVSVRYTVNAVETLSMMQAWMIYALCQAFDLRYWRYLASPGSAFASAGSAWWAPVLLSLMTLIQIAQVRPQSYSSVCQPNPDSQRLSLPDYAHGTAIDENGFTLSAGAFH
ncbi:hypothetical protein V8E36_009450 [Tilletia maclaganii]